VLSAVGPQKKCCTVPLLRVRVPPLNCGPFDAPKDLTIKLRRNLHRTKRRQTLIENGSPHYWWKYRATSRQRPAVGTCAPLLRLGLGLGLAIEVRVLSAHENTFDNAARTRTFYGWQPLPAPTAHTGDTFHHQRTNHTLYTTRTYGDTPTYLYAYTHPILINLFLPLSRNGNRIRVLPNTPHTVLLTPAPPSGF
jgi:hypothetical protein